MALSYFEKLKDPRWQKKRLEILERDEFTCSFCEAKDKTLHVHHGYYQRGCDPWDYDDDTLHTLCEACHQKAEALRAEIYALIGACCPLMLEGILGYVQAEAFTTQGFEEYSFHLRSAEHADGLAGFFGLRGQDIIYARDENSCITIETLRTMADLSRSERRLANV